MAASLDNNSDDGREKNWTQLACAANAGDVGRVLELLAGADRSGIDIDGVIIAAVRRSRSPPEKDIPLW